LIKSDKYLPLYHRIDLLRRQRESFTVAIDGSSGAGKSSLAALLQQTYFCNVISMDDFFLRPIQKTPERLAEPGGNIDYERFASEIIQPLKTGKAFAYRPYNCKTGEFSEPVAVIPNPITVIEGVYSLHPHFAGAYDITVFLSLDGAEQRRRLLERNQLLYERFMLEWIPMENKYFDMFQIAKQCDFVFHAGQTGGIA